MPRTLHSDPPPVIKRFLKLTEGKTAKELAEVMGISYFAVIRLRNGVVADLKLTPALRLCRYYGISPWSFESDAELPEG